MKTTAVILFALALAGLLARLALMSFLNLSLNLSMHTIKIKHLIFSLVLIFVLPSCVVARGDSQGNWAFGSFATDSTDLDMSANALRASKLDQSTATKSALNTAGTVYGLGRLNSVSINN